MIVDADWLERHGVSRQLRRKYVMRRWLLPLARGVYRRPSPSEEPGSLPWQVLVVSLNTFLHRPISVGARTALELQGFSHYVAASASREAHLYISEQLPKWVSQVPVNTRLVFHNARRLFRSGRIPLPPGQAGIDPALANAGLTQKPWGDRKWTLLMSTPERAVIELLDEVPRRETFHQADVLMEGLRNLSPRRLQALLTDCKNVKVKRLFFWFAERHNHAWLSKIDRSAIGLGKGKRMLARGGRLDPKYNITVPEDLDGGG
jgi:hypothetical protein